MSPRPKCQGITLLEVLVTLSIVAVTGAILLSAMQAIAVNAAKNGAINLAHQQARQAINRVVEEIRESASIPQLLDGNLNPLPGSHGPAAGVSYQIIVAGPYRVFNNANASSPNIRVFREQEQGNEERDATNEWNQRIRNSSGLRLIIPAFQLEKDIVSVLGFPVNGNTSTVHDVRLNESLGVNITCMQGTPVYPAYFTQRSALVVVNGELRHYRKFPGPYNIVARNLVGATPFSVPGGNNRFIQMNLVARDSRVSQRGYKAVDLRLNVSVPIRYQLTSKQ